MAIKDWCRRKPEQRNYTAAMIKARCLAVTVQTCVGLWESTLALADVGGTAALTARHLAIMGRSLANQPARPCF